MESDVKGPVNCYPLERKNEPNFGGGRALPPKTAEIHSLATNLGRLVHFITRFWSMATKQQGAGRER